MPAMSTYTAQWTTPEPVYTRDPYVPPSTLPEATRALLVRARAASVHVTRVLPGPVGAVVRDALLSYIDHGYRFDTGGQARRLVDDILARPLPAKD